MWRSLGLALTFLTIIPAPRPTHADAQELSDSMAWFPTVGLILGIILTAVARFLQANLPPAALAAVLVALLAILTRGLHLDGLADTLDGLGGSHSREGALRIMKDHAVGAFGAVGIVLALLLKYGCCQGLLAAQKIHLLPAVLVISRFAMVLLAYLSPYARPEGGLGQAMTTLASRRTLVLAGASAGLISGVAGSWLGLMAVVVAALLTGSLALYFRRRLGGVTGDVCGAVNEIMEVVTLIFLLGVA